VEGDSGERIIANCKLADEVGWHDRKRWHTPEEIQRENLKDPILTRGLVIPRVKNIDPKQFMPPTKPQEDTMME
jgi:hypothetical protein